MESTRQRQISYDIAYKCSLKNKQTNNGADGCVCKKHLAFCYENNLIINTPVASVWAALVFIPRVTLKENKRDFTVLKRQANMFTTKT